MVCFAGAHLAICIVSATLTCVYILASLCFAGLVYDSHPLSANLAGKAHGRVDLCILGLKLALVIIMYAIPHEIGSPWVLVGVNIAGGVVWSMLYHTYMPYVSSEGSANQ